MRKLKSGVIFAILLIVAVMGFMPLSVEAEAKRQLSTKKKSLTVNQEYKLRLKGLRKKDKKSRKQVKWIVSDKSVVAIKKKTKYSITIKARKSGVARIVAKYRGKKYTGKIRVVNPWSGGEYDDGELPKKFEDARLNADDVTIYYISDEDKDYIAPIKGHIYSFQFAVSGVPKNVMMDWSIESKDRLSCFKAINGKVYMWMEPSGKAAGETATLIATLENGQKLTAKLHGYSERQSAIDSKLSGALAEIIEPEMNEYEKLESIATYVSEKYEYELCQSDWMMMVLKGSGDCFSSRYLVKELCDRAGIRALACVGENIHGITLAKADGKFYEVITGFNDKQPRKHLIYELTDESVKKLAENSRIDLRYFD